MNNKPIQDIENGTVIDHIPPGQAMKCIKLMHPKIKNTFLIGMNLNSNKMKTKDFIKIENHYPSNEEINKISLIAPNATINTIKNKQVTKKTKIKTPKTIKNHFKCINPKCITNTETYITTKFKIEQTKPLLIRCTYCDKQMNDKELTEH